MAEEHGLGILRANELAHMMTSRSPKSAKAAVWSRKAVARFVPRSSNTTGSPGSRWRHRGYVGLLSRQPTNTLPPASSSRSLRDRTSGCTRPQVPSPLPDWNDPADDGKLILRFSAFGASSSPSVTNSTGVCSGGSPSYPFSGCIDSLFTFTSADAQGSASNSTRCSFRDSASVLPVRHRSSRSTRQSKTIAGPGLPCIFCWSPSIDSTCASS
mmetsp:Transcript_15084/g.38763  ORF Transcript_15084/g.38763 Transcript_15084/m.38763 type:complete len:213 (+) Transcript_15084:1528-2166(+)